MHGLDEPLDELDAAILREAASLRSSVAASSSTAAAWDDFVDATGRGGATRAAAQPRRRWVGATAAVMVAATIAALVILHEVHRPAPTQRPDVTNPEPPPTTGSAASSTTFVAVVLRRNGDLVAVGAGRTDQVIGHVPLRSTQAGGVLHADVSASGWVAATQFVSEGFWFYDLHHPEAPGRFVSVAGPVGGHDSDGVWNPAGTLYAANENERVAAVVDPITGTVDRLPSADPPIGYPPTWTADGTGILTGEAAPECVTPLSVRPRRLAIVPIDGGPESKVVPALADGLNGVSTGGVWLNLNRCTIDPADGLRIFGPKVVVADARDVTTWVDHVETELLMAAAFSPSGQSVLALTRSPNPARPLLLWEAREPFHSVVVASFSNSDVSALGVAITAEAPDGSALVVRNGLVSILVGTSGGGVMTLDGSFAGFVPTSLVDELSRP